MSKNSQLTHFLSDGILCKVCGQPSSGNHFGVASCRACAAFFRRAANSKWGHLPCKTSSCWRKLVPCKPCRLKRCLEAGMSTLNFQFNRDILKRSLPRTVENFIGRSKFVIFCDRSQKSNKKTFINVRHLIDNAAETLLNGPESPVYGRNQLQKLANGFGILNGEITIKMIETMSKEETADCWEYYIASTAKWDQRCAFLVREAVLTYFDEFQKLPHCLQIKLTLSIWHVWGRLEKHAFTAVLRKQKLFTDKHLVVVGRNALINLKAFKYDHSWLSNYPPEQVEFFTGVKSLELYEVVDHLMSLEPTHIELTFMLAQLSFHYAASRFPEENEILKVTERFQQILSNDLHDYYVNDMNTPRYSVRMAQMMKINNLIQKYVREIRPRAELARTFEIFSIEFSHPEIFHDTGF